MNKHANKIPWSWQLEKVRQGELGGSSIERPPLLQNVFVVLFWRIKNKE